jgi:hypothetical protein
VVLKNRVVIELIMIWRIVWRFRNVEVAVVRTSKWYNNQNQREKDWKTVVHESFGV